MISTDLLVPSRMGLIETHVLDASDNHETVVLLIPRLTPDPL